MINPELELKKIIFISYVNRSGSTFLGNTLSQSKEILVFPEAEILVNLLLVNPTDKFKLHKEIEIQIRTDSKLKYWKLTTEDLSALHHANTNFDAFVIILVTYKNKFKPNASVLIFKAERIIYLYENIKWHFSDQYNLLLIGLVRDPRAVYESQKRTEMSAYGTYMSKNPVFTAITWNHFVTCLKSYKYREDFILIKYEDLILRYKEICSVLYKWIGIQQFDLSSEGDLFERLPHDQCAKHKLIKEKPLKERINLWEYKLYKEEIYLIEKFSKKIMNHLNYQPKVYLDTNINIQDFKGCFYWANYYLRMVLKKLLFRFFTIAIL